MTKLVPWFDLLVTEADAALLGSDLMLFGSTFTMTTADGQTKRIAPEDIIIKNGQPCPSPNPTA